MSRRSWNLSFLLVLASLLAGTASLSQPLRVDIPPSLIIVNYDRMSIGNREGLEAGAFVARTNDAGANWYNPAGLSRSEKSALNAAGTAYEWSRISLEGLGEKTTGSRLKSVATYFSGVVGAPVISSDKWRFGFSITTPISWSPGVLDPTYNIQSSATSEILGYYSELDFSQMVPAVAAGYAPGGPIRLGFSLGGSITHMRQIQSASYRVVYPTSALFSNRNFNTDGTAVGMIATVGLLYEFSENVNFGLRVVAPSMRLTGSSRVSYQASLVDGVTIPGKLTSADIYFRDKEAKFEYKYPIEVDAGLALKFGNGEIEADVKYHGKISDYDLYTSEALSHLTTLDTNGVPSVTESAFAPTMNSAHDVLNLAIGGNYAFDSTFAIHAGFRSDLAPVVDGRTSIFRKVDLYGATLGLSIRWAHLSGSAGLAYSTGVSEDTALRTTRGTTITTSLGVTSLQILFAISYAF